MSSYHGRRAPNVSQYLANLNTIPSTPHDVTADISIADADLEFLSNTQFFDFDSFNPHDVDSHTPHSAKGQHAQLNGHNFQFGEFQTYPNPASAGLHGQYPTQPSHAIPYGSPQTGDKRKASVVNSIPSPQDLEEQSRMAAEEDKRRRNTAASARFRVKKKQREQALEMQAKEMTDKVSALESKVQQLEMENKWLKGLITDKNDGKGLESMKIEKETEERKPADNTDGVGTIDELEVDADAEEI